MNQGTRITCTNDSYEIIGQIGRGSYGIVFKAKRLSDHTLVAIKIPADRDERHNLYSTQKKEEVVKKIRNEIKQLKKFGVQAEKNHIVPLLDWYEGQDDNRPVMVMPLSEGTLSSFVRYAGEDHRFTCDELLTLIQQMLMALSFIHQKEFNIIHRDIKLDNFLLINQKLFLCDFGEKKELKHDLTCSLAGTPICAAPELFIPEKIESMEPRLRVTHKADIYSVGLIIYNLIMFAGDYPKAQSLLWLFSPDPGQAIRENAPESFQKIGGLEEHEKQSCIKYLNLLATKNALPFPDEFVQTFMQFLELLLCPVINERLDASGAFKHLKHLQDMIHPQMIQFNTDFHLINFRQNFPLNIFLSFRFNYACLIFCMQNTDMIDIFDALIIVSYALIFYIGGTICRINMLTKY